jgi:hypothetical protein
LSLLNASKVVSFSPLWFLGARKVVSILHFCFCGGFGREQFNLSAFQVGDWFTCIPKGEKFGRAGDSALLEECPLRIVFHRHDRLKAFIKRRPAFLMLFQYPAAPADIRAYNASQARKSLVVKRRVWECPPLDVIPDLRLVEMESHGTVDLFLLSLSNPDKFPAEETT